MTKNRQVLLARRPEGQPVAENFELAESEIPTPGDGEMLLRTVYLSLDPYMRGRMNAEKSYAEPVPLGGVMEGGTVSVVEKSNSGKFAEGDILVGRCGWQDYAISDGTALAKVDACVEWVKETFLLEGKDKVIVFAHHKAVLDALETQLDLELKKKGRENK